MMGMRAQGGAGSTVRCAVYCRVSNDDGLSQAFTSLDAQQVSGESFVAARKGEGWSVIDERFHDGGYSGGNMDRPGLQRLIELVQAKQVEVIVVYKLDRFTRSIRDFGKLAEILEQQKVALVSVTQSIDTGTSMGRLMMHVLLSFAAFERELASERTRDKIALSRQKGRWTGGRPPLGYDAANSTLTVNTAEASMVRAIFAKYLELGSLSKVIEWANEHGVRNKAWTTKAGEHKGGSLFFKSTLAQLLSNPIYIGQITHKETSYPGIHEKIIDPGVFKRVQELLAENGRCGPSLLRNRYGGVLKGMIVCGCCGGSMVHSITSKKVDGRRVEYRYYTCLKKQAQGATRCSGRSVQAEQLESFVIDKVRSAYADPALVSMVLDAIRARSAARWRDLEARRTALASERESVQPVGGRERAPLGGFARDRDEIERELLEVDAEIASVQSALPDRKMVQRGLDQFEALWSSLTPAEKSEILRLTVKRVHFDGVKGEVQIEMLEDGDGEQGARAPEAAA